MKKVILVVEDENEIRKDLITTLQLCDYEAYGAENGIVGLSMAKETKPDLIISDIMMPELDGYGLLQEIQKDSDLSTIPFLFLSAKTEIREGMNLGADDYITKPYDIDELLSAIKARIKKKEVNENKVLEKFEDLSTRISQSLPHEIRTPLGMILGYSDFLLKNLQSMGKEDIHEMLENINESGKRLNRLFENHLFYAKLETLATSSNELQVLKSKKTEYADMVIKDLVLYIASNSERISDLNMDLEAADIMINEKYLIKIIEEIMDNALKFSEHSTPINVSSKIDGKMYVINFTDHGRGMSKEQINSVGAYIQFERQIYEQQGSGLGLAIVKKICKIMDCEFAINSENGKSTTVEIRVPLS